MSAKRRVHEEEHEEHENHERWLLTYADMITLLMALFIVMFAISQVDSQKFMALKTGLQAGFGAPIAMLQGSDQMLGLGGAVAPDSVNLNGEATERKETPALEPKPKVDPDKVAELVRATTAAAVKKEYKKLDQIRKDLVKKLRKAGMPRAATFRYDERGLVVSVATDNVLFDDASAVIRPQGRRILDTIGPTLSRVPNRISVDGHTNSIPISTDRYPSNWELSADRATGVLRYLVTRHGLAPETMSATGFADTHPLRPASDPRSVVVNRRVEIVILATLDNAPGRSLEEMGQDDTGSEPEYPHVPQERPSPAAGTGSSDGTGTGTGHGTTQPDGQDAGTAESGGHGTDTTRGDGHSGGNEDTGRTEDTGGQAPGDDDTWRPSTGSQEHQEAVRRP